MQKKIEISFVSNKVATFSHLYQSGIQVFFKTSRQDQKFFRAALIMITLMFFFTLHLIQALDDGYHSFFEFLAWLLLEKKLKLNKLALTSFNYIKPFLFKL